MAEHGERIGQLRRAVIEEAKTWLLTPWEHAARVKGAGVDCAQLLAAVYTKAGVLAAMPEIPYYPRDWHQHQNAQVLRSIVEKYADKVEEPVAGGIVLFEFGKVYSHAAIIIEWPLCIHANMKSGIVEWIDASVDPHLMRCAQNKNPEFFSPWGRV
jgi:cell wall-associated NlpC family hydrolase